MLPLSTPTPPPSPASVTSPLPSTLPQEYPQSGNPLDFVQLTAMIDYWFHSINIAANFHGARVLLWKDVHRLQSSREPSSDADDPTLEEDFRKAMGDILPEPRPREFTPHLDPLFNLIHAQQTVTYPSNHPAGSSRYYEAMYTGGYSSMETVMSAAVKHGKALQHALDKDIMALGSVDTLMEVVKGS